jgi:hypothetical protein
MSTASLEVQGFAALTHKSGVSNWNDEKQISGACYAEAVELVKKATGAKDAVVFDHTLRKVEKEKSVLFARDPVESVHLDYSERAREARSE